jgi:chorismate mutase
MTKRKLDILPLEECALFEKRPLKVIAGPCGAETCEQVLRTASSLSQIGVNLFRAGLWKPRTYPGSFEGVGTEGLAWLQEARNKFGIKIATEVASKVHVQECLEAGVDLVWIGARTTANPFLVQEIADALVGSDIPVLVKNPVSPDLDLWIGALERLNMAGVRKLGVIHRGFTTFEKKQYRNDPQWQIAIELRSKFPSLPFFVDPSHIAGHTDYVGEISQRALDLGFDGLMIESHCSPSEALSDSIQQLTPAQLDDMLNHQLEVRNIDSDSPQWKENIHELRAKIDVIDESILAALSSRMQISRQIGQYKKENNIAILQTSRWDAVLAKVIEKGRGYGLSEKCIIDIFNTIHEESVEAQNQILSDSSSRQK